MISVTVDREIIGIVKKSLKTNKNTRFIGIANLNSENYLLFGTAQLVLATSRFVVSENKDKEYKNKKLEVINNLKGSLICRILNDDVPDVTRLITSATTPVVETKIEGYASDQLLTTYAFSTFINSLSKSAGHLFNIMELALMYQFLSANNVEVAEIYTNEHKYYYAIEKGNPSVFCLFTRFRE